MEILEHFSYIDFYLLGAYPKGDLGGLLLNIFLAVISISLSFSFGVLIGYSRLSSRLYVKIPCIAFIEIIRATPLIMILFWFYYVIPYVFGMNIPVLWSVVLSLSIYAAAYQAEIVRSGILAVSKGQLETALSSGMSRYSAMGNVILPQAFRMMLPSFARFFISLFKDTSTIFIIGVIELTQAGFIVSTRQPDKMYSAYVSIAAGFFIICLTVSHIAEKLEKKIGVFDFQSYIPDASRDEFMLFPKYKFLRRPSEWISESRKKSKRYAMLINLDRCIGCHACQVTCKAEHNIPFGIFRCKIETSRSGHYPDIEKSFMPRMCNHCDNPPCIDVCEEKDAIFKTPEGIVLINTNKCLEHTECKKCYEFCPYNAIDINKVTGKPEKCDFCYSRLQKGEQPVCAASCMGNAITFGDINDKHSEISVTIRRRQVKVLDPENEAGPNIFYLLSNSRISHPSLKNYELPEKRRATKVQAGPVLEDSAEDGHSISERKLVYTADSMCPSECGISVLVEDGKAKKIYGNPHSLVNNGTLCAKGAAGLQLTYSPNRIKTPLMRTGQRGEDKWKPVTWEEAADYVTKKLVEIKKRHGAESVFLNTGDMSDSIAYERLFRAFGTPNIYGHGCICDPNRRWGHMLMTGDTRPLPDVQRPFMIRNNNGELYLNTKHDAKLIINIGVNPFVATRFNYMSNGITGAQTGNNCKYIVVDPAHTNSAALADMWLPIIPGTDAELLAAMLLYIIRNDSQEHPSKKYIDHEFIDKYTEGWPEFLRSFLVYSRRKDPANDLYYFSLDWAKEKTGISKKNIKKVAHMFGGTKPASIEIGMHGTSHHTNGDVTSILMTALCLITGNVDRPGGLLLMGPQKPKKGSRTAGRKLFRRKVTRTINGSEATGRFSQLHKDLYGDYPSAKWGVLTDLPNKIKNGVKLKHGPFKDHTYPVKAYITRAGNPVITAGSTPDWIDALTNKDESGEYSIDLTIFIDTHISVTGKYADIVFPEAGYLERMGLNNVYTASPEVALRDRVIEPLHESKTPFDFMIMMADYFVKNSDPDIRTEDFAGHYENEEAFINEQLATSPGFYNIGSPLPYPDLPEGCLVLGTPDNPRAVQGDIVVSTGEMLTVDWLRKHNGVAIWPASYFRYKKADGTPSGSCPETKSGKFEFTFSFLENLNKKFGENYPTTFYWSKCNWNPKNPSFNKISRDYPFQLISGRVHYSMTMTAICSYLGETTTECMEPLNNEFSYCMPETCDTPDMSGITAGQQTFFKEGRMSIPVLAINRKDGENLGIRTGDIIILENPLKKRTSGKAFLTEEIMPGVIKVPFGPGGQKASGLGFINSTYDYTPNINELHDPANFNPLTGTPGFGDIIVKIIKCPCEL